MHTFLAICPKHLISDCTGKVHNMYFGRDFNIAIRRRGVLLKVAQAMQQTTTNETWCSTSAAHPPSQRFVSNYYYYFVSNDNICY